MVMKVIVIIRMPSTVARAAMLHTRAGEDRVRRVQGLSLVAVESRLLNRLSKPKPFPGPLVPLARGYLTRTGNAAPRRTTVAVR